MNYSKYSNRELIDMVKELRLKNAELTNALGTVARYSPPDAYAPDGELRLELSPRMNDQVLKLLREGGL